MTYYYDVSTQFKAMDAPVYRDEHKGDLYRLSQKSRFRTGQSYDSERAAQYYCVICRGRKFYVGYASYCTVIACVKCGIEVVAHDG